MLGISLGVNVLHQLNLCTDENRSNIATCQNDCVHSSS
jgi:hypothetical protein